MRVHGQEFRRVEAAERTAGRNMPVGKPYLVREPEHLLGVERAQAAPDRQHARRSPGGLGRVLINSAHVRFRPKASDILRMRYANTGSASRKTLLLGKRDMHDQLAFRRVAGNLSFARRILGQNDTSRWKPTNIAIACLEFDLA